MTTPIPPSEPCGLLRVHEPHAWQLLVDRYRAVPRGTEDRFCDGSAWVAPPPGEVTDPSPEPECGSAPNGRHEQGEGRDRETCIHCDAPVFRPSVIADGPGVYEVVVECRFLVTAASRRFAHLRAEGAAAVAFGPNGPAPGRVRAASSRKVAGPEFEAPAG